MIRALLTWLLRPKVLDGCRTIEPSSLATLSRSERLNALALLASNPGPRLAAQSRRRAA